MSNGVLETRNPRVVDEVEWFEPNVEEDWHG